MSRGPISQGPGSHAAEQRPPLRIPPAGAPTACLSCEPGASAPWFPKISILVCVPWDSHRKGPFTNVPPRLRPSPI